MQINPMDVFYIPDNVQTILITKGIQRLHIKVRNHSTHVMLSTYTSIACSKIEHIPYKLIFTTIFNDSSIFITIISWDYLNLSLNIEYVGSCPKPGYIV
jgi:hypothetical protein